MGRTSNSDGGLRSKPEFSEALGRTIKVLRTDLGIERRDLAERVGISYSYLTEIENGNKPPSSAVLGPIAEALGLRMSQLIDAAETRMHSRDRESPPPDRLVARMGLMAPQPGDSLLPWPYEDGVSSEQPATPEWVESCAVREPEPAPERPRGRALHVRRPDFRGQDYAMRPSLRGPNRDIRAALIELERHLHRLAPEDVERLLDFARRLAR